LCEGCGRIDAVVREPAWFDGEETGAASLHTAHIAPRRRERTRHGSR
jgi:hypothetical protein